MYAAMEGGVGRRIYMHTDLVIVRGHATNRNKEGYIYTARVCDRGGADRYICIYKPRRDPVTVPQKPLPKGFHNTARSQYLFCL